MLASPALAAALLLAPPQPVDAAPAPAPVEAKTSPGRRAAEIVAEHFDLYGRLAGHLGYYQDGKDVALANNASRFGLTAGVSLANEFQIFGELEYGVKLGEGDEELNLDTATGGQFGRLTVSSTSPALATRLGNVGIGFGRFGKLSFGKQWSVYYDVTKHLDRFDVFGVYASSTLTARTDGGSTGSGRANDALSYRVELLDFELGMQAQFFVDGLAVDGAAGSLIYRAPFGMHIGAAYNRSYYARVLADRSAGFVGAQRPSQAVVVMAGYRAGAWDASALYARSWRHELIDTPGGSVVYDADGVEAMVAYTWRDRLRFVGGYNMLLPRGVDSPYLSDGGFSQHAAIAGLRVFIAEFAWVYTESLIGLGKRFDGSRLTSAVTVGVRLEFSSKRVLERVLAAKP